MILILGVFFILAGMVAAGFHSDLIPIIKDIGLMFTGALLIIAAAIDGRSKDASN